MNFSDSTKSLIFVIKPLLIMRYRIGTGHDFSWQLRHNKQIINYHNDKSCACLCLKFCDFMIASAGRTRVLMQEEWCIVSC